VKPKLLGRDGNYRFFAIYDARDYTDVNSGETKKNTGFGLSFDQEVVEGIGLFARYDTQDGDIAENVVKFSISGGISLSGRLWNRSDDVLGIGYGVLLTNDKAPAISALANPGDEGHFEIYYKFGITDHFTVAPDLQVITSAGGDSNNDTITIPGVRVKMNF
jgi:carbohydrate-selective porin OprB